MTQVTIGYDTRFAIEDAPGSGVFVELEEVFDVTPPEVTVGQAQATHYQSPGRAHEYIPAISDNGTASAEMNFIPGSPTDLRLQSLKAAATVLAMRITYPNGVTVTFDGFVATYSAGVPLEDRMTATAGFKVSGEIVIGAAAAPVSTVLPAIAGTVQQGQTLTAWPGMWTTGAAYGYQWQEDDGGWTNITGAAGPTFVPGAGQVGNALRVIVTATNAAGSASATSAPTVVTAGV